MCVWSPCPFSSIAEHLIREPLRVIYMWHYRQCSCGSNLETIGSVVSKMKKRNNDEMQQEYERMVQGLRDARRARDENVVRGKRWQLTGVH